MSEDMSMLESKYHQITDLYDLADDLVSTAEDPNVLHPDSQLDLVEPLIQQISDSTDVLCEEFIEVAGKRETSPVKRTRIESALRRIYMAIDAYARQSGQMVQVAGSELRNIADPIVHKIKLQVEHIIGIFIDFVDLSLDRIMQKQHVEELRARQEKVAQMLYANERRSGFEMGA